MNGCGDSRAYPSKRLTLATFTSRRPAGLCRLVLAALDVLASRCPPDGTIDLGEQRDRITSG